MTLTRDVVKDLLPVYLAGESSADTRRMVDEFLAGDAALAGEVRPLAALNSRCRPLLRGATRSGARRDTPATSRTSTLAMAVFFTLAPFTSKFDGSGFTFVMWRDKRQSRWRGGARRLAGIAHFWIRSRTRVSGL
jgi:anti-sigma factor RsiW